MHPSHPMSSVAVASSATAATTTTTRTITNGGRKHTYISRLILRMEECLNALHIPISEPVTSHLESMAILIHESMSISSRNYHSVQHVFDISEGLSDPLSILAALFHDCVYYNVDGGLSQRQQEMLKGVIVTEDGGCTICHGMTQNPIYRIVCLVFGVTEGMRLTPLTGVNEFMSAIVAVRELEPLLPILDLAKVAACIEATIPFRPTSHHDGDCPMERLYQRMITTNQECNLQMTDEEIIMAVQNAALLSNEDVANFGSDDCAWFLDNTWSLLPESNSALRQKYLYTVKDFQFAVFKMYGFFSFLQPEVIFQRFRGVPSDEEYQLRTSRATINLCMGRKYVGAKVLSLSVLAAFSELTGGDAPISLFMGDLPSRSQISQSLDDSLPRFEEKDLVNCDPTVYRLLAQGRTAETAFDIKQSPLGAFLYGYLGDSGVEDILQGESTYPMTKEKAVALLTRLPRSAIHTVAENIGKVATSRTMLIERVLETLPWND